MSRKKKISKKVKGALGMTVVLSVILVASPYARAMVDQVILRPFGITCLMNKGFGNCKTQPHPEGALTRKLINQEKAKKETEINPQALLSGGDSF